MKFQLEGRVIFFATNNVGKFIEAKEVFREHKIAVGMLRVKGLEIQSDSLEEIAKTSAIDALGRCHLPLIVEDAGLFIEALNGFPGPYAAHAYKTIGNKGILKLMENERNRKARFESAVAYHSAQLETPICFRGQVTGEITREERKGSNATGFGFDPIFKPVNSNKTFAEMSTTEKNRRSHRANALNTFAEWYKKPQET
jgi:XTP/dITP diphosphohydrolase